MHILYVLIKVRAYFVKTVGCDCDILGLKQTENRVCDFFDVSGCDKNYLWRY